MHETTDEENPAKVKASHSTRRQRATFFFVVALLVLAIGFSVVMFIKYRHVANNNPAAQQKELTKELRRVAILPPEQPAISTVLDSSKLTNRLLARHAHDGDKLFIFQKSKRLVLYRPSEHKVVDMLTIQN